MNELNNTHEKDDFLKFLLKMYDEKQYKFFTDNWRTFEEDERLEILYRAYRDNIKVIINPSHFQNYTLDKQVLVNGMQKYADKFGLAIDEINQIFWGFKGKRYESQNKEEAFIERALATYVRLREYHELTERYAQVNFGDILKLNLNILRCDSNRTESRLNFLLEENNGTIIDKEKVAKELSMVNWQFNLMYQKEIEQKLFLLEPGTVAYNVLASKSGEIPDFAYDKFLELALRVIYGDEKLIKLIESERKKVFIENQAQEGSKKNIDLPNEVQVNIQPAKEENDDEIAIKELLFEGALPAEEGMKDFISGSGNGAKVAPNAKEYLNEDKIKKFLKELKNFGIKCEGYIESDSGFKAVGEESVRFYVLKVEDYIILESIGQVGNGTYIMKSLEDNESLKKLITSSTKPDLVRSGIAIMLKHERTENQEYMYSAQRLANMATVIKEFSRDDRPIVTFADIKKQVTKLVPKEEAPNAAEYVWSLGISQKERLAKKIVELEGKLSATSRKRKNNESTEEAGFDD